MPAAGVTHDTTIANADGTTKLTGFMFDRSPNGHRGYQVIDAQTLAPRIITEGEVTQAQFPAEYQVHFFQEDWRAGLGGINHRLHPKKIALGTKVDASIEGRIRLAREVRVSTVDTNPSVYKPSGFAIVGTEIHAFIGRDAYFWDYTESTPRWEILTEPIDNSVIYRNGVEHAGRTYVPAWYPDSESSPSTISDTPSNYLYKQDSDAQWTRAADSVPGTNVRQPKYFAVANGLLWGANWARLVDSTSLLAEALDNSETGVDVDDGTDFSANDIILIDDELMSVTSISTNTLTVVRGYLGTTAATHSDNAAISIRTVDTEAHQIRSLTTAPTTWSTAFSVGESDSEITALVGDGETLLVCKTNGLWAYYADGTTENLTPEFEFAVHKDNFRGAFNWNGHIMLPLGTGGMMELSGGKLYDVSMSLFAPDQTALHGQVVAMHGEPTKLYIMVDEPGNTQYHILMAQWAEFEGETNFRWHHLGTISYTTGTSPLHSALFFDGLPETGGDEDVHRRLLIGYESSGSSPLPLYLPDENDINDGYTDDTDALAQFTLYDANYPQVQKSYATMDVTFKNLNASSPKRSLTYEYSLDGGSNWKTDLTGGDTGDEFDGTASATGGTLSFPADTTSKTLDVRVKMALDTIGTTSPEHESIRVTAQLRFDQLELLPMELHLADNLVGLNGGGDCCNLKDDLAQLRTWDRDAAAVVVVDAEKTSHDCVFLPGAMKVREKAREPGRRPEYVVSLVLAEV